MRPASGDRAVIIGNFDGVHRGHVELIAHAVSAAMTSRLSPCVLTFHPHPLIVLGRTPPPILTPLARKVELIERLGATVHVHTFDRSFAAQAPEEFATALLKTELRAKQVYVGYNFRFGRDRAGDVTTLSELGDRLGFSVEIHARVGDSAGPWSSSRAREAIGRGDVVAAASVLGRWHALTGVVEKGRALGRTIGFPTANLAAVSEMLPPNGVYAVVVDVVDANGAARVLGRGVMNVGTRPTVAGDAATLIVPEVHLTDGGRDLYGETLRVHLVAKLRDEKKFAGIDALKAQIEVDRDEATKVTESLKPIAEAWA